MRAPDDEESLAEVSAPLFVRYDPLEPWLAQSHYDDSYWGEEARLLAGRLTRGDLHRRRACRRAPVLAERFPGARVDGGALRGDHIDALTGASWHLLRLALRLLT